MISRRTFLRGAAALTGLAATEPWRAVPGFSAGLGAGAAAPFDHVIVVTLENRSWDHLLGWLPGADGRQVGLRYTDKAGIAHPTHDLAPDFQGCGFADPDHSWEGGLVQLSGGTNQGFLQTAKVGDTFPIGYYTEPSVPVLGALARNYTVSDNYFSSLLAETYPNRFYQHAAMTPRDRNSDSGSGPHPTIWDRLSAAGVSARAYAVDVSFLLLWGTAYLPIIKPFSAFLSDCAAGTLPSVSYVDPSFIGEEKGASGDDHPHGDIRAGEAFLSRVYAAVRSSPAWSRTVMLITFDEAGGFFDHVRPPKVVDDYVSPRPGPHPDYRQLGFRVPNIVVSPFSHAGRVVRGGAPFEHTSALRMIEWRWGLAPLRARDANARNLADMLDFSLARTDRPAIPVPPVPAAMVCGTPVPVPSAVLPKLPPTPVVPTSSSIATPVGDVPTVAVAAGGGVVVAGAAAVALRARAKSRKSGPGAPVSEP